MDSREIPEFELSSNDVPQLTPDVPPAPPGRRAYVGWIFLVLIFSLLFVSQLHDYLTRGPSAAATFQAIDADIKSRFLSPVVSKEPKDWEKVKADLADKKGAKASRYRASIAFFLNEEVKAEDVKELEKVKPPEPLLKVLKSEDKAEQKELASKLTRKELSTTLVKRAVGLENKTDVTSMGLLGIVVLGFLFLAIVGCMAWTLIFVVKPDWLKLSPGFAAEPLTVQEADGFAIRAGQAFSILMILSIGLIALLSQLTSAKIASIVGYATCLVFLLMLSLFPANRGMIPWRRLGIRKENLKRDLVWGFVGYTMNLPILVISLVFTVALSKILPAAEHPTTTMLTQMQDPLTLIAAFFTACVMAPIAEEIIFRGLLLPALSRFWSRTWSIVVTSIVFAVIHPTGIPAWPALFGLAVVSSVLAFQTRSLVPSIVMHAIHNTVTLTMAIMISRIL